MTDDTVFSVRKQLESIQSELKVVSKDLTELSAVLNFLREEKQSSTIKLSQIESDVTSAKGAVALIKWIISVFGMAIISFCVWLISTSNEVQKQIALINQKNVLNETKIERLHQDIEEVENKYVQTKSSESTH